MGSFERLQRLQSERVAAGRGSGRGAVGGGGAVEGGRRTNVGVILCGQWAGGGGRRGGAVEGGRRTNVGVLLCGRGREVSVELVIVLDGKDGEIELTQLAHVLVVERAELDVRLCPARAAEAEHTNKQTAHGV